MTAHDCEGIAAVGLFLNCIWPFVRPRLGIGKGPTEFEQLARLMLAVANIILIVFAIIAIRGANENSNIQPGLDKFAIVFFALIAARHIYKFFKPSYFKIEVPSYGHVVSNGGFTYVAIPDAPPERTVFDESLTDFNPSALKRLVDEFACEIGPMHPEFFLATSPTADGRCLYRLIPGNWTELFWFSAANHLMTVPWKAPILDDDGNHQNDDDYLLADEANAASAILLAICSVYPEINDRVLSELEASEELAQSLENGYVCYLTFRDSKPLPEIAEALCKLKGPRSDES